VFNHLAVLLRTVYKRNVPNHHHDELAQLRAADYQREIDELRAGGALVSHALDCALQLIDVLITWMPQGTVLPEGVSACKHRLDEAMKPIRRRDR